MGFKVVTKKMTEKPPADVALMAVPSESEKVDNYWGILVKYIPAPMIAAYKILEEMFLAAGRTSEMPLVLILMFLTTPLAVATITLEGDRLTMEHLNSIKVQIAMAAIAFIIWILSMSRWLNFDPLWGTVLLIFFTLGAPALGKGLYSKDL